MMVVGCGGGGWWVVVLYVGGGRGQTGAERTGVSQQSVISVEAVISERGPRTSDYTDQHDSDPSLPVSPAGCRDGPG